MIVEAQNAGLGFNRQEFSGLLSANAPEFIPKAIPPQVHMNDWPQAQPTQQQVYSFQSGSRGHYVNPQQSQQHIPQNHPIHHQQNHIQQHQFRNQQQPHMQPQQFMMMNQRPGNQQPFIHPGSGPRASIQNRLQMHHNPPPHQENDGVHAQVSLQNLLRNSLKLKLPFFYRRKLNKLHWIS